MAMDGEALFIIIGNNPFDIGFGKGTAVFVGGSDQLVDIDPAGAVLDAKRAGFSFPQA